MKAMDRIEGARLLAETLYDAESLNIEASENHISISSKDDADPILYNPEDIFLFACGNGFSCYIGTEGGKPHIYLF